MIRAGEVFDGSVVSGADSVPYEYDSVYDILPGGDTGIYWADGILLKSTLY
jgi:hypothetical protein